MPPEGETTTDDAATSAGHDPIISEASASHDAPGLQSNDPIEDGLNPRGIRHRSTFVDEFLPLPRVATCLRYVTNNRIVKEQTREAGAPRSHWPPARGRDSTRRGLPRPPLGGENNDEVGGGDSRHPRLFIIMSIFCVYEKRENLRGEPAGTVRISGGADVASTSALGEVRDLTGRVPQRAGEFPRYP